MDNNYNKSIKLHCITCGDDSSFECNDNKSYIKCTKCNREYFGGYDELVELNQAYITQEIDTIKEEITSDIRNQLISIFKRK